MSDSAEQTGQKQEHFDDSYSGWIRNVYIMSNKEKLYTVEIPRRGNPDHSVLRKYVDGKVCIDRHLFDNWRDYKCFQLTEAEIKKEHGWTWKYAEEVK